MSQPEEDDISIEEDYDEKIKLMILGDSTVGKTAILRQYCQNEFLGKYVTTVGIDFQMKYINLNNKKIRLQIWDTAGQERYRVVTKNYFNASDGFIIVYDITNRETFKSINNWIEQITTIAGENIKCIIFGNKNDLIDKRQVQEEEGRELAKKYKSNFFETSAKSGDNVEEGFKSIITDVMGDIKTIHVKRRNSSILKKPKTKKKKNCC